MIDKELLAILACPETKEPVALAEEELIAALNSRIARGEVKNRAGKTVEGKTRRRPSARRWRVPLSDPRRNPHPAYRRGHSTPLAPSASAQKKGLCACTIPLSTYIMVPKRGFEPRRP